MTTQEEIDEGFRTAMVLARMSPDELGTPDIRAAVKADREACARHLRVMPGRTIQVWERAAGRLEREFGPRRRARVCVWRPGYEYLVCHHLSGVGPEPLTGSAPAAPGQVGAIGREFRRLGFAGDSGRGTRRPVCPVTSASSQDLRSRDTFALIAGFTGCVRLTVEA